MTADLLLRHGAKVNMTDERGVSPLHACIFHTVISRSGADGLNILRRLVAAGAILKPSSPAGQSVEPLFMLIFLWSLRWRWLGSRVVSVLDSGAEGPGFKSQSRRCRVTLFGKLFASIVPLFTKQQNW